MENPDKMMLKLDRAKRLYQELSNIRNLTPEQLKQLGDCESMILEYENRLPS